MGAPSRAMPGLLHGWWRRMQQARRVRKQTTKKVENLFEKKVFKSEMEYTNIAL